jgi:hypothetical protein
MKKLFSILVALMMVGFWSNSQAQIKWSGDLQVRPRYDMKDYGDYGGKKNDMYYMMRARINLSVDIGEGWYGKIQLAHYNYAGYYFTNGVGYESPAIGTNDLLARPYVNFTQMCFGYHGKSWGIGGGIIPMNALKNPMIDIHYYPNKMIDIPFTILNLGSATGFKGYVNLGPGKLDVSMTLDANNSYEEDKDGKVVKDLHDVYTFGANYAMKIAGFGIAPGFFYTMNNDSLPAPMTYGVNITTPKFGGFTFGGTFAMTSNSVDGTLNYDGMFVRVKATGKLGPGSVIFWYDYAKRTNKYTSGDVDETYGYVWAAYKIPVTKKVAIMPRARLISDKIEGSKDFKRNKIEVLFLAKF